VPLYAGPENMRSFPRLRQGSISHRLRLAYDHRRALFSVLSWFHQWVGNWGVAIILLTVLIKLCLSCRKQATLNGKMRVLAPKLQKLKDQYGTTASVCSRR